MQVSNNKKKNSITDNLNQSEYNNKKLTKKYNLNLLEYFDIILGASNFILTAPHGSNQLLSGESAPEPGDRGTDILAKIMVKKLNCYCLIAKYSRLFLNINTGKKLSTNNKFQTYSINEKTQPDIKFRQNIYESYYNYLNQIINSEIIDPIHIALHSMFHIGPKGAIDEGTKRPDFRLGTRNGVTFDDELLLTLKNQLNKKKFSVELNNIFCGGEEIIKTSQMGAKSIQIEINSKLFLKDDNTPYINKKIDEGKIKDLAVDLIECINKTLMPKKRWDY